MVRKFYTSWNVSLKERKPLTQSLSTEGYYKPLYQPKVLAIIQARTSSTRFPNKIYAQLNGAPLLYHTINRVGLVSYISTAVVASTETLDLPDGTPLYEYRGPVEDVLSRYYHCALQYKPDYIVRLTSDCPVLDPLLMDYIVLQAIINKADYCSNVLELSFPDGQDCEVMSMKLLKHLQEVVRHPKDREHVTLAFRNSIKMQSDFNTVSICNDKDLSDIKMSVDYPEDLSNLEQMELV